MNGNDDDTTNLHGRTRIIEGTTVYDAAGEKVGSAHQFDSQGGYLLIQKGLIVHHDLYVPLDAIARTDADGVYLSLYNDALAADRYANRPAMRPEASSVMAGAMPAADTAVPLKSGGGSTASRATAATDTAGQDDITVPVLEERLAAEKQRAEAGRVHLHKEVVEQQQALNVPLTHEEVRVERVPVQGHAAEVGPDAFQERDIEVPLMGERVISEKPARVAEEVRLHKTPVTEQRRVTDTVRKERVRIEGDEDLQAAAGADAADEPTLPLDQTMARSTGEPLPEQP